MFTWDKNEESWADFQRKYHCCVAQLVFPDKEPIIGYIRDFVLMSEKTRDIKINLGIPDKVKDRYLYLYNDYYNKDIVDINFIFPDTGLYNYVDGTTINTTHIPRKQYRYGWNKDSVFIHRLRYIDRLFHNICNKRYPYAATDANVVASVFTDVWRPSFNEALESVLSTKRFAAAFTNEYAVCLDASDKTKLNLFYYDNWIGSVSAEKREIVLNDVAERYLRESLMEVING